MVDMVLKQRLDELTIYVQAFVIASLIYMKAHWFFYVVIGIGILLNIITRYSELKVLRLLSQNKEMQQAIIDGAKIQKSKRKVRK